MSEYNFGTNIPRHYLWVSPQGSNAGSGSASDPLRTIQAAVLRAAPETAIMVGAGDYVENIKLPNRGGVTDRPIWLVSADGPQQATITAASNTLPVIKGLGSDKYVIADFQIKGGLNGIQFSQSGSDFTDMVENVVLTGNRILGAVQDGIKISQADNVHVRDNVVIGAGDQAIDFLAVRQSSILRNEVSNIRGPSAILTKGGSSDVLIANNWVHDVLQDGISVGGWSEEAYFRPGTTAYEARDVIVTGNRVDDAARRPLIVLGAQDSKIYGNFFEASPTYYTAIHIGQGGPQLPTPPFSKNIEIFDNMFTPIAQMVEIGPGNANAILFHGNEIGSTWLHPVGPYSGSGIAPPPPGAPTDLWGTWSTQFFGSAASEYFDGSNGRDLMSGGGGRDVLDGRGGDDRLDGGDGPDIANGSEGNDLLLGGGGDDVLRGYAGADMLYGQDGADRLDGGAGADFLSGGAGDDELVGGDGDDHLDGGAGNDMFTGGAGNDLYSVQGGGRDLITDFGAGDRVSLAGTGVGSFAALVPLLGQQKADVVLDFGDGATLRLKNVMLGDLTADRFEFTASSSPDPQSPPSEWTEVLIGTLLSEYFGGSNGRDLMSGGGGRDVLDGRGGDDRLDGGDGPDIANGSEGNDLLLGGGGDDVLRGYAGADMLYGQDGADRLDGGAGADFLSGGAGSDRFLLSAYGTAGDRIVDFEGAGKPGGDKIILSGFHDHASLSYSGGAGLWTVHDGAAQVNFVLLGVSAMVPGEDYVFK